MAAAAGVGARGEGHMKELFHQDLEEILLSFQMFAELDQKTLLRGYQREVARSLLDMILFGRGGRSMAVILPRQSGKNHLQAYLEAYLLVLHQRSDGAEIVKVAPTLRPQALNSLDRLESILRDHQLTRRVGWRRERGTAIRVGRARIRFFSAAPSANILGATASLLLSVDEAQSVDTQVYDTRIAPMAASRNSPRVFWGTAWTAETLLAREFRLAQQNEGCQPGQRRAFRMDALRVGAEVPDYAFFVEGEVRRLGRDHPSVRTQYFSEEIDAAGGLLPPGTLAGLDGGHAWEAHPHSDRSYAFLLDVGGEEWSDGSEQAAIREHDASALVIVAVEPGVKELPRYRVVHLRSWSGAGQPELCEALLALAARWKPRKVVVDATGLGQGLAAALEKSLCGRILRYTFSAASKSRLGWSFRALAEGRRFLLPRVERRRDGDEAAALLERLREQMLRCEAQVGRGPGQNLRWGVPESTRAADGSLLHDDLLVAAALCSRLDEETWPLRYPARIIPTRDPLREMDRNTGV